MWNVQKCQYHLSERIFPSGFNFKSFLKASSIFKFLSVFKSKVLFTKRRGIKIASISLTLSQSCSCFFPVGISMFKVNNESNRTLCEICSKLTKKTPEWHQSGSGVFMLTLNRFHTLISCFP